jgi:hypothetical protein
MLYIFRYDTALITRFLIPSSTLLVTNRLLLNKPKMPDPTSSEAPRTLAKVPRMSSRLSLTDYEMDPVLVLLLRAEV